MTITTTHTVVGMTCDHCVAAVRSEVASIDGVGTVDVDLATGRVTVESEAPITDEQFAAAIDEAGYEVGT